MYGVVASNRDSTMSSEIGDIDAGDVGSKTIDGWMERADATATLCNRGNDFVFVSRSDSDDDVLRAWTLNAVFEIRLRRDGAGTRQDRKSCEHQDTHSAAENHGLYYSKGSAMSLARSS